jgi:hypothetical protein
VPNQKKPPNSIKNYAITNSKRKFNCELNSAGQQEKSLKGMNILLPHFRIIIAGL